MTVFTKTNDDSKEVPKVVVSEPSSTPTAPPAKERDISNAGWKPMEGGNFDRPVKERSSSFGPLSIIRLSPSPLARTPSPTIPENGNSAKKTKRRLCIMLFVLVVLGMILYLGAVFFHYHARLVRFAYHEGVDHGKMAARYDSLGLQNAPVKAEMKAEQFIMSCCEIGLRCLEQYAPLATNFGDDYNLTAIIDAICKRCFAKQLYDHTVSAPINLMQILTGSQPSHPMQRTVRGKVRICGPLRREEILALGSIIITETTCSSRN